MTLEEQVDRVNALKKERDRMIDYAGLKLQQRDWHGLRDACVDIELLEAESKALLGALDARVTC